MVEITTPPILIKSILPRLGLIYDSHTRFIFLLTKFVNKKDPLCVRFVKFLRSQNRALYRGGTFRLRILFMLLVFTLKYNLQLLHMYL